MGDAVVMTPRLEIGIDCADPRGLAAFWAEALGYRIGEGEGDPYLDLLPPDGTRPVVFLQRVPEPKRGKNRVHLDLYVDDPLPLLERLERLGARPVGEPVTDDGAFSFQVMADPEGNELCVCQDTPGRPA
ncbi:VOC family protein [soil metagenome]